MNRAELLTILRDGRITDKEYFSLLTNIESRSIFGEVITAPLVNDSTYVEASSGILTLAKFEAPYYYSFLKNNNLIRDEDITLRTFNTNINYVPGSNIKNFKNYIYKGETGVEVESTTNSVSGTLNLSFGTIYNNYENIPVLIFLDPDNFYSDAKYNYELEQLKFTLRRQIDNYYKIAQTNTGESGEFNNYVFDKKYKDMWFTLNLESGYVQLKDVEINCNYTSLSSLSGDDSTVEPFTVRTYYSLRDRFGNLSFYSTFSYDLASYSQYALGINAADASVVDIVKVLEPLPYKLLNNKKYTYRIETELTSPSEIDVFFFAKRNLTTVNAIGIEEVY